MSHKKKCHRIQTSNIASVISRALWYENEEETRGPKNWNQRTTKKHTNHTCDCICN